MSDYDIWTGIIAGMVICAIASVIGIICFDKGRESAFEDCKTYGAFYIAKEGWTCTKAPTRD